MRKCVFCVFCVFCVVCVLSPASGGVWLRHKYCRQQQWRFLTGFACSESVSFAIRQIEAALVKQTAFAAIKTISPSRNRSTLGLAAISA